MIHQRFHTICKYLLLTDRHKLLIVKKEIKEAGNIRSLLLFLNQKGEHKTMFFEYLKKVIATYDEILKQPHRAELARELRDEEDLFMLLCFSEMLGIPNPAFYYTLELYPIVIERFHEWHVRMGMEKSPLDGIRCC